jgi:peptidoglycan/xylan/chitin deacetylase (PgdA/CDA1 family)
MTVHAVGPNTFPFTRDTESPYFPENLSKKDLVYLAQRDYEVGSHTVNHVDLGTCSYETAISEVTQSKKDLEKILIKPIVLFAYPFGCKEDKRNEVVDAVRRAG